MTVFKKQSLRNRDDQRTGAAEVTFRQSIYPLALVTVLFFLWGFSYGLLNTLNKHFQNVLGIGIAKSAGLQAAYFCAYPLASLGHANWILRHLGFKAVFIWGLSLYALGALVAWPCILYQSFGGFCAAIFIIGNGLGSLETAANPFITICGTPQYAEIRINISQAFNGIGTVIAPVIGSYAIFVRGGDSKDTMHNVQLIYLAMACFCIVLAVVFYFSPIPEITDKDMEVQAKEADCNIAIDPFWKQYRLFHAAFANFCYMGSQIAIAAYFINYVTETRPNTSSALAAQFLAGAQGAFAIGRFAGAAIMKKVRSRWVLLVHMTGCIVFIAPAITQQGDVGMAMLFLTLFFESICFPTIMALGMRGLGKYSKRGSGFLVAGKAGGAVAPPILGATADAHGIAVAMVVPLCFFVGAWTYSLAVNFIPAYRTPIDSFSKMKGAINDDIAPIVDEEEGRGGADVISLGGESVESDDSKGGFEKLEVKGLEGLAIHWP